MLYNTPKAAPVLRHPSSLSSQRWTTPVHAAGGSGSRVCQWPKVLCFSWDRHPTHGSQVDPSGCECLSHATLCPRSRCTSVHVPGGGRLPSRVVPCCLSVGTCFVHWAAVGVRRFPGRAAPRAAAVGVSAHGSQEHMRLIFVGWNRGGLLKMVFNVCIFYWEL